MKTKYNKRKYKMQSGVQRIENDSPDYSNAYKIRAEQNAKNQIGANIGAAAANIAMPGLGSALQGVGAISDSLTKDAKGNYKNKAAEIASSYTNPLATTGKALSALTGNKTAAADLFSGSLIGTGLGALGVKNPFGKTTQEKVKEEAVKQEEITKMANINKRYTEATATDAQAALAKKGKYKVKTKEPRLIETEGREPIFSPKKPDGTRDLLYYNPNDPTHEEGGVKAVVMPKAQKGKRDIKSQPITIPGMKNLSTSNKYWNKDDEQYYTSGVLRNNDPHVRSTRRDNNTSVFKSIYPTKEDWQKSYRKEDSYIEDFAELIDPTGILSHDDLARAIESYRKAQDPFDKGFAGFDVGTSGFSAIPIAGRGAAPFRLSRQLVGKQLAKNLPKYAKYLYKKADDAGNVAKTAWETTKKYGKKGLELGQEVSDYFGLSDVFSDKSSDNTQLGMPLQKKAYGAKQIKVKELNDTSLSQNLGGMPAANAANKFVQPMAGKMQVARQIPEYRRKEKQNTPRSHRKENPDTNRIIDPPMLYEMKPPPPRSTFNTKNNFQNGTKSLNSEKKRKADSTRYAQNVYSVAKQMANKNMQHLVTENRPGYKNYGKKTGANTCLTTACAINKMTGTNLPFDLTKARNADPRVGDNILETRYNPAFLKNHENLGYKLLKENDKMQPGDLMQIKKSGIPTHAKVFLGNAVGPILAEDHGENNDDFGVEISNEYYRQKYITVKDAKKDGYGWVYRYIGLPAEKKQVSKKVKVYK